MFQAFERHLATKLSEHTTAPWQDRIHAALDPAPAGEGGHIRCGFSAIHAQPRDMGQRMPPRPLQTTAIGGPLASVRGLYLDVRILIQIHSGNLIGVLDSLEQMIYILDDPNFRQGRELDGREANLGFFIEHLVMSETLIAEAGDRADIHIQSRGWFWPTAEPAADGGLILDIQINPEIDPESGEFS